MTWLFERGRLIWEMPTLESRRGAGIYTPWAGVACPCNYILPGHGILGGIILVGSWSNYSSDLSWLTPIAKAMQEAQS